MLKLIFLILSLILFQNCANKKRGVILPLLPLVQETPKPASPSSTVETTTPTTPSNDTNNNNNPTPSPVVVQFQTTTSSATEGLDPSVSVVVSLASPLNVTASVDYQVSGGTALPSEYSISPTTLTFNPGETQKSFTVTIVNDAIYSAPTKTLILTLTNLSSSLTLGTNSTHTLTIIEDEDEP